MTHKAVALVKRCGQETMRHNTGVDFYYIIAKKDYNIMSM